MRFSGERGVILAAVAVSLACALGAWLFIHLSQRAALEGLERRALDLAAMIADRAERSGGDPDSFELGNRLGPFGELLYLEVELGGEVVLRKAKRFADGPPPPNPAPSVPETTWVGAPEGRGVAVFYPFQDPEQGSGYVWLVLARPLRKEFRFLAGVVSAVALAVDLSALAVLYVWAWGRRGREEATPKRVRVGTLEVDLEAKRVYLSGRAVRLTPKEFALLSLLASSPGRVFSSREILNAVWPDSKYADDKNVKQCVYSLRKKLGEAASGEELIVTEPGFGYFLRTPEA